MGLFTGYNVMFLQNQCLVEAQSPLSEKRKKPYGAALPKRASDQSVTAALQTRTHNRDALTVVCDVLPGLRLPP